MSNDDTRENDSLDHDNDDDMEESSNKVDGGDNDDNDDSAVEDRKLSNKTFTDKDENENDDDKNHNDEDDNDDKTGDNPNDSEDDNDTNRNDDDDDNTKNPSFSTKKPQPSASSPPPPNKKKKAKKKPTNARIKKIENRQTTNTAADATSIPCTEAYNRALSSSNNPALLRTIARMFREQSALLLKQACILERMACHPSIEDPTTAFGNDDSDDNDNDENCHDSREAAEEKLRRESVIKLSMKSYEGMMSLLKRMDRLEKAVLCHNDRRRNNADEGGRKHAASLERTGDAASLERTGDGGRGGRIEGGEEVNNIQGQSVTEEKGEKASIHPERRNLLKPKKKRSLEVKGFNLFQKENLAQIKDKNPNLPLNDVLKLGAAEWKSLSSSKQKKYLERAQEATDERRNARDAEEQRLQNLLSLIRNTSHSSPEPKTFHDDKMSDLTADKSVASGSAIGGDDASDDHSDHGANRGARGKRQQKNAKRSKKRQADSVLDPDNEVAGYSGGTMVSSTSRKRAKIEGSNYYGSSGNDSDVSGNNSKGRTSDSKSSTSGSSDSDSDSDDDNISSSSDDDDKSIADESLGQINPINRTSPKPVKNESDDDVQLIPLKLKN